MPIIDFRIPTNEELHEAYNSYVMRARLDAANGTHANQVIWTGAETDDVASAFQAMDRWLSAIEADHSDVPLAEKVIRNRPVDVVDSCWIAGRQVLDANTCRAAFPYYSNPRIAAGAPFTNDVLKCRLRPLDRADYNATFTDAQWTTLQETFGSGVCDWRVPGVEQRRSLPWLTYRGGPGGQPLGDQPASTPTRAGGR